MKQKWIVAFLWLIWMQAQRKTPHVLAQMDLFKLEEAVFVDTDAGMENITAEETEKSGTEITVCVLDSGCNDAEIEGWNYIEDNEDLTDPLGHGTAVCRLIARYAPTARRVILKCFTDDVETETCMVTAIYDAVDIYHADVLNISWTGEETEKLHEAIQYAYEHDIVIIAAAGNLSWQTPLGSVVYPAAWQEVIGVGGVDVDADGNPLASLWYLQGEAVFVSADGTYQGKRGSSYATPRVSAVAANYLQERQNSRPVIEEMVKDDTTTPEAVQQYLQSIAEDAGEVGYDPIFGWGYVRMRK